MADRTSTVRVNVIADSSGAASKLGSFGKVAGLAALGVAGLAVGVGVGVNKLADFADVAGDANERIENVAKQMGIGGRQYKAYAKSIELTARELSRQTAVDENVIKGTQAKLLTFKDLAKTAGVVDGAFNRATEAAVDMASVGFGTAEENAVQLGKALQDPANGLTALKKTGALTADQIKKIGDEFTRTGDISKAQSDILTAIETQVGGTAAATAGGFEKMKNEGKLFANDLALKVQPYLDRFGDFMINTGGPAIKDFANTLADRAGPALKRLGEFTREQVIPALQKLGVFIRDKVVPALIDFGGWVNDHVVPALKEFLVPALEGAKDVFNQVKDAVHKNREPLQDMFEKFKKVAEFVLDKVVPVLGDFAKTHLHVLGTEISTAVGVIATIWTAFNDVYNIVKSLIGQVKDLIDWLGKIHVPDVNLPGPLGKVLGRTAGRVTINLNGPVTDPRGTAREIAKVMRREGITSGAVI